MHIHATWSERTSSTVENICSRENQQPIGPAVDLADHNSQYPGDHDSRIHSLRSLSNIVSVPTLSH
jgi:hypothetical protein